MAFKSFGLDRVTVEHRALSPTHPFVCNLPPPISVNAMYGQAPGRKRFHSREYAAWIEDAALILNARRPPKFTGQVWISITYADAGRMDLDNGGKGIIDLLKSQGVIKDDSRRYVREIRYTWGNVHGAKVEVRPFPFEDARAA